MGQDFDEAHHTFATYVSSENFWRRRTATSSPKTASIVAGSTGGGKEFRWVSDEARHDGVRWNNPSCFIRHRVVQRFRPVSPLILTRFPPATAIIAVPDRLFVGNDNIGDCSASKRGMVEASEALELFAVPNRKKTLARNFSNISRRLDGDSLKFRVRLIRLWIERTVAIGQHSRRE